MSTICLIRHGSTEANERRLYCGSTDLPLSKRGAAELEKLKGGYLPVNGYRFVTSGMRRTEDTLRLLFGDIPHVCDSRFREMGFGIFEMHSYEQLKDVPEYQAWIGGGDETNAPPGGEDPAAMKRRAIEAFSELMESPCDMVVVTHGGVIAAIMEHLYAAEGKNRYQWQPKPGHGYMICESGYRTLPF